MKRAIIIASMLGVAAMGTGLAVQPAFSEPTSHTLTLISRDLASQQTPRTTWYRPPQTWCPARQSGLPHQRARSTSPLPC
jgi:hypothetical protein